MTLISLYLLVPLAGILAAVFLVIALLRRRGK